MAYRFTPVELLSIVGLLIALSIVSLAFTAGKVHGARVLEGENQFAQAFSLAKSAALGNAQKSLVSDPVVVVCRNDDELSVREWIAGDSASTNCSSSDVLWRVSFHRKLNLKAEGNEFVCACLSQRGQLTTLSCSGCISNPTLEISSGREQVTIALR